MELLQKVSKKYLSFSFSMMMAVGMAFGIASCESCGKTPETTPETTPAANQPSMALENKELVGDVKEKNLTITGSYKAGDYKLKLVGESVGGTFTIAGKNITTEGTSLHGIVGVDEGAEVKEEKILKVIVIPAPSSKIFTATIQAADKNGTNVGEPITVEWREATTVQTPQTILINEINAAANAAIEAAGKATGLDNAKIAAADAQISAANNAKKTAGDSTATLEQLESAKTVALNARKAAEKILLVSEINTAADLAIAAANSAKTADSSQAVAEAAEAQISAAKNAKTTAANTDSALDVLVEAKTAALGAQTSADRIVGEVKAALKSAINTAADLAIAAANSAKTADSSQAVTEAADAQILAANNAKATAANTDSALDALVNAKKSLKVVPATV